MIKSVSYLITLIAMLAAISGCGGSSSSSSAPSDPAPQSLTVQGTASAPPNTVASLRDDTFSRIVLNALIEPAAAAITGLQPVDGATVELIRVDNNGDQVGEVLAEAVTSTTGNYTLTLPQGVNLAGNLVVRITGNNAQMRSQVVDQQVDIDPASEFVLRKFIQQGTNLEELVVNDVVELKGKVDEFDLTAGADLTEMLEKLETEVGQFVESQVAVINEEPGNAAEVAGDYRANAFSLGLHDSEDESAGTYANDLYSTDFTFANGGNGTVTVTLSGEESADAILTGNTVSTASLFYETDIETLNETFSATLTDTGILSLEGEFEEDIDGDNAFRYPPTTYNLQGAPAGGLFFQVAREAGVRYGTTESGALDPQDRRGEEAYRALEVFARAPQGMTDADLVGDFGRVYFSSESQTGDIALESETNVVTFDGNGSADASESDSHRLSSSVGYSNETLTPETDLPVVITEDGDIVSIGDEEMDGFINDTFDFISLVTSENETGFARFDTSLLVKLPDAAPDLVGKRYRLLKLSNYLAGNGNGDAQMALITSRFNSFVTIDSATEATLEGSLDEVYKSGLAANLELSASELSGTATVNVEANGAATLTSTTDSGETVLDGFFNQDASYGVFTVRFAPTQGDPDEFGLAVLVEVPASGQ
jgi:hypothetical protein